ncbi:3-oxoacyl-ACP synthase III family protein [Mesonia aquimarina]|uniref:3-oxoacyl-ACP synthase III family protein n=1 Tax=Mesonia aquimarina TaxID=1504967 RepID=UPI000EF5D614|nr:ketoacyl-ACP synthase III [Mesonia aquimarina]
MPFFSISDVKISGIAAAVPKNTESNWDYDKLSATEKKLLVKTTGVENRRVAPKGLTTSDLCLEAAKVLLKELDWKKDEVDILVFLSQSRDYYLPATSIILQDRLGLSTNCMAFDIGLGCSGYPYGISVVSSLLKNTGLNKALLMMGDISSATCAKEDKSTYPLFGDAGSVTALEYDESAKKMCFQLNSKGEGYKSIIIKDGGIRNLINEESFIKKEIADGIKRCNLNLALNGLDVFNFSITDVPKSLKEFLSKTNSNPDDYDYFLMHQANKLMNETIRKKLKFQAEKVPYSIKNFGNTSSASIPLTLVTQLNDQAKKNRLRLLLSGFGVGLSWGIVTLEINKIACPKLIEV